MEILCRCHSILLCIFMHWSRLHVPFDLIIRSFIILLSCRLEQKASSLFFSISNASLTYIRICVMGMCVCEGMFLFCNPLRFYLNVMRKISGFCVIISALTRLFDWTYVIRLWERFALRWHERQIGPLAKLKLHATQTHLYIHKHTHIIEVSIKFGILPILRFQMR